MNSCIQLNNVYRHFGAISVLERVNLRVDEGEVRAMVGEHGAGKSTIAAIIGGLIPPTAGSVTLYGRPRDSKDSPFPGVEIVHQTVQLMENLTVSENMLATDRKRFPSILGRQKRLHAFTNEYLAGVGVHLRGEQLVGDLKRADLVLIDILRKLYREPRLLILDEAIEQLSNESAEIVINILKRKKEAGLSVIYITHRIDDVYTFADTVSIVKNGTICLTEAAKNIDKINLIKIAYTQLSEATNLDQYNEEFFHLLKYNEAILRKLPVSLIVVNRDETIKIINEAAQLLLDMEKPEGDTKLDEVFANSPGIVSLLQNSFGNEQLQQFYYLPFRRSDSKEMLINISKVPIYDEHFLIGNILLLQDITEQELLRQEFELREKLAATGLLAAGVAHEINNPLGMILNDLHFLKLVSKDTRIQSRVSNLEKHFGFITGVVSNLLSFSDREEPGEGTIELNSTIAELLHLLEYYARSESVELTFDPAEEQLHVRISGNELKQILLNLIKNSIEAFTSGGTIQIATRRQQDNGTDSAYIHVKDDGPGIAEERINDLFLPFNSAKQSNRDNLGLGLSVSYSLVQKYHCKIRIDTEVGKGCLVTLLFPIFTPQLN